MILRSLVAPYARGVLSSSDDAPRGEASARIAEVLGPWDMSKTISRAFLA